MAFGGASFGSRPRPLSSPTPSAAGPVQGLSSAAPRRGGGGMMTGAARSEIQHRQMEEARHQPRMNADGSWMYNTSARPERYNMYGQPVYGFGNTGDSAQTWVTPPNQTNPGMRGLGSGSGGEGPSGPMGGLIAALPPTPEVANPTPVDDTQAAREAYARAKDTAGQQGRAAMDSLMDVQGARGIVGSGIGVNEAGGVIGEGARQLGDFNSQQLQMRVDNERRRQEMIYSGLINQRGQNISLRGQELDRRRFNANNSPRGHVQGEGVNPIPGWPRY